MLEWMGKQKVLNHHNEVPFHVLERKWGFVPSRGAESFDRINRIEGVNPVNPVNPVEKTVADPYLLDTAFGVAYCFCYEKDKSLTLNRALLRKLKTKADSYVIYADACTLSPEELEAMHIVFKKIPRDVTRL